MTWWLDAAEQKAGGSGAAGKTSPPVAQQPVEMFFAALAPHLEVQRSSAALLRGGCCKPLRMHCYWASHQAWTAVWAGVSALDVTDCTGPESWTNGLLTSATP